MKYVEVSYRSGGRLLTKRFPARSAGTQPTGPCAHFAVACKCGFILCGCPVPVPRGVARFEGTSGKVAVLEPPADVLPEGWTRTRDLRLPIDVYVHSSGAEVHSSSQGVFYWWRPGASDCNLQDAKPTRDAAMTAALASVLTVCVRCGRESPTDVCSECARTIVQPAEPTLRAGWERLKDAYGCDYYKNSSLPGGYSVAVNYGTRGLPDWSSPFDNDFYETAEAAMIAAEELARG